MSEFRVNVQAPSNIALIKYMGKKDAHLNIPENSSLSMTLKSLCSLVDLQVSFPEKGQEKGSIRWVPEAPDFRWEGLDPQRPLLVPPLQGHGVSRVIQHLDRVRSVMPEVFCQFGLKMDSERLKNADFRVRTANTFPASSGIASSASSFAALTLAMAAACAQESSAFQNAWISEPRFKRALAQISRTGSGSSCRSFEGPWVLWQGEAVEGVEASRMPPMAHFVILVRTEPKKVSSSQAHAWVRTSPLWKGRVDRVEQRTEKMRAALAEGDLSTVARIAWTDSWEMHSLFHTCAEPFSYWEPGTIEGLHWFAPLLQESSPPIVTLDAGPNIHVIVEKAQQQQWRDRLHRCFQGQRILEDEQGTGASLIRISEGAWTQ